MTPTAAEKRHWARVIELGCLVTRTPYVEGREGPYRVTLHHARNGSMTARGIDRMAGRKTHNMLVIPIIQLIHIGPYGIDGQPRMPVGAWERRHRTQAEMIDEICDVLSIDLWAIALADQKSMVPRRAA